MPKVAGKDVGEVGFGLMGLTWRETPPPQSQSFEAMRAALSSGCTNWNGGQFYGTPEHNSLHLLNAYFTKYPEDADKVVISIKGGLDTSTGKMDGTKAGVQKTIDNCLEVLDGKKFLDLFEFGRVDLNVPIEETVGYMAEYVKAGKLGGISLTEVGSASIRKAHAVHPIAAVEVEFSLYATEILENGVAATCAELGIPIVAYSPMGRGFLNGKYRKFDDLEHDSLLRHFPRFQPDVFDENIKLADAVMDIAKQRGVTPAQIANGWVLYQSNKPGMPTLIPIPGASTADRVVENSKPATLSESDFNALQEILEKFDVKGGRYPAGSEKVLFA